MWAAVIEACQHGQLRRLRALLNRQTHPERDQSLREGVVLAANHGHLRVIQYLEHYLELDLPLLEASLAGAARWGQLSTVQYLISSAKTQELHLSLQSYLSLAVKHGHLEVARYLVSIGTLSVYAYEQEFYTACATPHLQMVQYLADVCGLTVEGEGEGTWAVRPALEYAAAREDWRMMRYILTLRMPRPGVLRELLMNLVHCGNLRAIRCIIQSGVEFDDITWLECLVESAYYGHGDLLEFLLQQADCTIEPRTYYRELGHRHRFGAYGRRYRYDHLYDGVGTMVDVAFLAAAQGGRYQIFGTLLWEGVTPQMVDLAYQRHPACQAALQDHAMRLRAKSARSVRSR